MQSVASWFVAAVVVLVVVAFGSIYGADYFERAWGRGGSLQIVLMVGLALALAGAVGYVIAANVRSLQPSPRNAMLAGATFEIVLFAFVEGTKYLVPVLNSPFVAGLAAFVLGSASTWLLPRRAAYAPSAWLLSLRARNRRGSAQRRAGAPVTLYRSASFLVS